MSSEKPAKLSKRTTEKTVAAAAGGSTAGAKREKPRLQVAYEQKLRQALKQQLGLKNDMEVPKLVKISLNMGLGADAVADSKLVNSAANDLTLIAGQKAIVTHAKKSEATFKLREGVPIGCKVTLRRKQMYEFMDRLVSITLPRIRDFRGFTKKSFDGQGNFSLGFKEQILFPEINFDKTDKVRGLNVTIVTNAKNAEQAQALLQAFNIPFKN